LCSTIPPKAIQPSIFQNVETDETRGQTGGVHPKTETEIMVTVLDQENSCHTRTRINRIWNGVEASGGAPPSRSKRICREPVWRFRFLFAAVRLQLPSRNSNCSTCRCSFSDFRPNCMRCSLTKSSVRCSISRSRESNCSCVAVSLPSVSQP